MEGPGGKRVDPDLAVIPGVENPDRDLSSFDETEEGTRPVLVLEVLSEATESTDYEEKPTIYQRSGIKEYFLLNQMKTPWMLEARRLHPATGRYRKVRPGRSRRVASETLEVLFEVGEDGKSLVLTYLRTGERLRDHRGESEARRAESEARRVAEERYRSEAEARRAAEKENRRLRALLERQAERS